MLKPKLSIVLPAIRPKNWNRLYHSIQLPFSWELIVVSPYPLPEELIEIPNIKHLKDKGSPMRASCIGANLAEGKYLTWIADDGIVFPETINKSISFLDQKFRNNFVVVTKYLEACSQVHPDEYYKLNHAYPSSKFIPDEWWIFNTAIMHRTFYEYLGGWDTQFEACPLGHADLAVRAQRSSCITHMIPEPLLECSHMPGTSGDHGPVHFAQIEHDAPLYKKIYEDSSCQNRTQIDPNGWKNSPPIWKRRFS